MLKSFIDTMKVFFILKTAFPIGIYLFLMQTWGLHKHYVSWTELENGYILMPA